MTQWPPEQMRVHKSHLPLLRGGEEGGVAGFAAPIRFHPGGTGPSPRARLPLIRLSELVEAGDEAFHVTFRDIQNR